MKTIILAAALLVATALAENFTRQSPGTGRIVNGINAEPGQYPFLASMWEKFKTKSHFCGAAIIAPRWLLTAAHCAEGTDPKKTEVRYGITDLASNVYGVADVDKFKIHPHFSMDAVEVNDIAMIKLKEQIFFTPGLSGIANLPRPDFQFPESCRDAAVAGWGLDKTGGSIQRNLKVANLTILSDQECKRRTQGATTSNQYCCVGSNNKNQGCSGDSGSPLICKGDTIVGLFSWMVEPCGLTPIPEVYIKLVPYLPWVNETMAEN